MRCAVHYERSDQNRESWMVDAEHLSCVDIDRAHDDSSCSPRTVEEACLHLPWRQQISLTTIWFAVSLRQRY
jgi:hypothetical protein